MRPLIPETPSGYLIGAATAATMGMIQSGFYHRKMHGAVEYPQPINEVGKAAAWLMSGMNEKEWEVVHLTHHAFTDKQPTPERWAEIQQQYPGAPIEVFRDPHSFKNEAKRFGHLKVLALNAPMYRRAAKTIMPYVRQLEADNVPRELWPPHLQHVDLTETTSDRMVYNRKMAGVVGLVALGAAETAILGPKKAAKAMAVHVPLVLTIGGLVNSMGHLGTAKGIIGKARVMLGIDEAVPDADGSYASDFFEGFESLVAGEGRHGRHHKKPRDPFLSSRTNPIRDLPGVTINAMSRIRVRGQPLARLPYLEEQNAA